MKIGLQGRYAIFITIVVFAVIMGLSSLLLMQTRSTINALEETSSEIMKQELHRQLEHRAKLTLLLLADNLINPLYIADMSATFQLLATAKQQKDIQFTYILNEQGLVIHDGLEAIPGLGKPPAHPLSQQTSFPSDLFIEHVNNTLISSTPVKLGQQNLGTLVLGISTKRIDQEILRMNKALTILTKERELHLLYIVLIATLCFVFIGAMLSIALARQLTQPIKQVAEQFELVGQGDYDIDIQYNHKDELGDLVNSFQKMVFQLRDTTVSKDFLDNIISSMHDSLIIMDLDGSIRMVNDATARLISCEKDNLISVNFSEIIAEDNITSENWIKQIVNTGNLGPIETNLQKNDGSVTPVAFTASLMHNNKGQADWIVCAAQDISERKHMDKMKDEFISIVSHELRTPLTGIYGALSLLSSEVKGDIPEENMSLINMAYNNSIQLVALIDDLLDAQKILSGKIQFDILPLDVGGLLQNSIKSNQLYAGQHNIKLQIISKEPKPIFVMADNKRLLQVMTNLISNAVKFSPQGGTVEISFHRHEDIVEISVQDYGSGIPDEFKIHLFERFTQADGTTTRKVSGTGLGLNISKEIIEKLGGEIGFDSESEHGARFYIRLPVIHEDDIEKRLTEQ